VSGSLKPLIRISNVRQNNRLRLGSGFTLHELKAAKLGIAFARSIGVSVDTRRRNVSEEGLQRNVARLNEYKSKLVLFPKRKVTSDKGLGKGLVNDANKEARKNVVQLRSVFPLKKEEQPLELREITPADRKHKAWRTLRTAKKEARAFAVRVQKRLNPPLDTGKKPEATEKVEKDFVCASLFLSSCCAMSKRRSLKQAVLHARFAPGESRKFWKRR
jgi:large subunit ribosomal protein L13e